MSKPNHVILSKWIDALRLGEINEDEFSQNLHELAHPKPDKHPVRLLKMANLIFPDFPELAINLIYNAIAERILSEKPEVILTSATKVLRKHGHSDYAEVIYKGAIERYPENMHFYAQLGDFYIQQSKPKSALELLKPLHDSGRGNTLTATTLGNAYVITTDQKGFDTIKENIEPETQNYLQAKLYFLINQSGQAYKIVQPYVAKAKNIEDVPQRIMALYMATLADDSPILHHLSTIFVDERRFIDLMEQRKNMRNRLLQSKLENPHMASSQQLWELGGVAASGSDRDKAGLSPADGALVAVKRSPQPK